LTAPLKKPRANLAASLSRNQSLSAAGANASKNRNALTAWRFGPDGWNQFHRRESSGFGPKNSPARFRVRQMLAYWPILLMLLIALGVAAGSMIISRLITISVEGPNDKRQPWECGMESEGSSLLHVPVKFYLVCLLFLLFDVETIFLIAWAASYSEFGGTFAGALYWLGAMGIFLFFLVAGLVYEWKRGALEW
jgi:NADH-quinone oxidoreductase subunit A